MKRRPASGSFARITSAEYGSDASRPAPVRPSVGPLWRLVALTAVVGTLAACAALAIWGA